jgi:tRNA (guanine37-N1)-methyltransferase
MKFDILTIFPQIFDSYVNASILKRGQEKKLISIKAHDIRQFTKDKHRKVDDRPVGGGAGMVMMAQPILDAVGSLKIKPKSKTKVVIMSAKGKMFNQKMAYDWAKKYDRLVFVSGRYEGIDERVKDILKAEEVSIGPYVLTDGDVAAMVIMSAVARLIPGVIRLESLAEESHWNLLLKKEARASEILPASGGGLEYPHYTRPETFIWKGKKHTVPKVLLSGNHALIDQWRESSR